MAFVIDRLHAIVMIVNINVFILFWLKSTAIRPIKVNLEPMKGILRFLWKEGCKGDPKTAKVERKT